MKRLVLVDSHSLIHRAYHALPKTFITKDGKHTNAVYGYTRMLLKVIEELSPDYLGATFDAPGPTFRTEMAPTYKAHRPKADRELVEQFDYVDEIVDALGIHRVRMGGYEADDLIATMTKRYGDEMEVIIVTGDNDLMQLVTENVKVYYPVKGISQSQMYGVEDVRKKFDLEPSQIADYKALRGDPSDNIPGVVGIGEKTAVELLKKYGSLEGIYRNIEDVNGRTKELLEGKRGAAELSKKLASLEYEVPVKESPRDLTIDLEPEKYIPILAKYQFFSLLKQLSGEGSAENKDQLSLL